MIAIRLVVLAVLAWIAWLLLRSLAGLNKSAGGSRPGKGSGEQADPKVQDILIEDPVCHTLVPKKQAIRLHLDGTTYYFCSDACCDKFAAQARGEE